MMMQPPSIPEMREEYRHKKTLTLLREMEELICSMIDLEERTACRNGICTWVENADLMRGSSLDSLYAMLLVLSGREKFKWATCPIYMGDRLANVKDEK